MRDNCFESDLFLFSCLSGEDINVVSVVMGGADYAKLVIPGTYINVLDFKTVKQLADYLQYLDKNNMAYNEYFKWRVKYKVFRNSLDLTLCQICKWYVSKSPLEPKVYGDLVTERDDVIRKIILSQICGKNNTSGLIQIAPVGYEFRTDQIRQIILLDCL